MHGTMTCNNSFLHLGDANDDDGRLYPLGRLETMFWWDDRLLRCVKVLSGRNFPDMLMVCA